MNKLILIAGLLASMHAHAAQTISVTWNHPTEREDGSTLPVNEIKAYKVYKPIAPGVYEEFRTFSNWGDKGGLPYMFWYIADDSQQCYIMTAIDQQDRESKYSGIFCSTVPPAAPGIVCQ